jgi:hypothetical protein
MKKKRVAPTPECGNLWVEQSHGVGFEGIMELQKIEDARFNEGRFRVGRHAQPLGPGAGEAPRGTLYIRPQGAGLIWGRENKHCPSGGGLHLPPHS